jgi:peptide/nickel transport system permease protein
LLRFVVRRLGQTIVTLLTASFLVFVLVESSPGTVARKMLGPFASTEQVQMLYESLHLDDPLMLRYVRWLGVLTGVVADPLGDPALKLGFRDQRGERYFGNFGFSTQMKQPVSDVLWERLGNSLLLAALAVAVIIPLALAMGMVAAINEGSVVDRAVTVLGTVLASVPEFASGVILVSILVVTLGWLPGTSPLLPSGRWPVYIQFILPVAVLALFVTAYVARFVRTAFVEVLATPYIRTAILKGLPPRSVIFGHAFRNAMIAPFTVILLQVNWLLSGVVVTEVVFAYPGIGRLLLEAALFGDIAVIEAATLVAVFLATLTQFIGDIGYMLLNPRIRL